MENFRVRYSVKRLSVLTLQNLKAIILVMRIKFMKVLLRAMMKKEMKFIRIAAKPMTNTL